MIEYLQGDDTPMTMAKRLAERSYPADSIHAALLNSFGRSLESEAIHKLVRKNRKSRFMAAHDLGDFKAGLMKADNDYRESMEKANQVFLAKLAMAAMP